MTRTEKENLVPVWERITISLEEAAAYSGIGVRKLRDMTDKPEYIRYENVRERSECKGRAVCAWSRRCNDHARYLCDGHERPEETRNHSL